MVKRIPGRSSAAGNSEGRKQLHPKRMRLKRLHKDVAAERSELLGLPLEQLPPASSSNAARQARSRANITFPVDWQALHLKKSAGTRDAEANDAVSPDDSPEDSGDGKD